MPSRSWCSTGGTLSYSVEAITNISLKGSVMHWIAPYHLRGSNGDDLRIFTLYIDASNYVAFYFDAGANTVTVRYRVAAVNYDLSFTPDAWTYDSWIDVGASWNAPNGFLKAYWEGTEVGTPVFLRSGISTSTGNLYLGNSDNTKQFIGRRDRFDLWEAEMLASDFERFTVKRFV